MTYTPDAYEEVHTETFKVPEDVLENVPAASWDGNFPCVYAAANVVLLGVRIARPQRCYIERMIRVSAEGVVRIQWHPILRGARSRQRRTESRFVRLAGDIGIGVEQLPISDDQSSVHSDGTARYYFYENDLLTWIRDQKGNLLVHNTYDDRWVVDQTFGSGKSVSYYYRVSKNGYYAVRVTVTMPDGTIYTKEPSSSVSYIYKR